MKKKHLYTALVLIITVFASCKKDLADNLECDSFGTISYSGTVQPLLMSNCSTTGCHTTGFSAGDFTSHAGSSVKVNNGTMRKRLLDKSMPPNKELSDDEIRKIVCWIDSGALNN